MGEESGYMITLNFFESALYGNMRFLNMINEENFSIFIFEFLMLF